MKALRRFAARLLWSVTRQRDEARLQEELEARSGSPSARNAHASSGNC